MVVKIEVLEIEKLRLDPQNPRLPAYVEREQDTMLEFLARSSSIEELMSAISENDFFQAESLIGIPENDKFIIVEGNRRLTALKLLAGSTYDGISTKIMELREEAKFRPKKVPVAIYKDRSEVLNYLGNRHIAGVKPWGALAKARYIKQIFDGVDNNRPFTERCKLAAKSIGSRRDFISKSMRALHVYDFAETRNFFDLEIEEKDVKFSIISTAIDYSGVQTFIFKNSGDDEIGKLIELATKELFSWLFVKDRDGKVRVGESRNLNKLSKILLSKEALASFRSGATLQQAYLYTTGVNEDFDGLCFDIQRQLREANSYSADVDRTENRAELANSIFRQAKQLDNSFRD